jgi:hypothetical protein
VEPRRNVLKAILRRAVDRGELRGDLDLEDVVDLLIGPLIYEILITGADMAKVSQLPARILEMALEGLAPTPASPAPARHPPAA